MVKFNTVIYMMDDYLMKCSNDYIRGRLSKIPHEEKQKKLFDILSTQEYHSYNYWWESYQVHKELVENYKKEVADNPNKTFFKEMLADNEKWLARADDMLFAYEKYIYRKHTPKTYSSEGYTEGLDNEAREVNAQKNVEFTNKEKNSLENYLVMGYSALNRNLWNGEKLEGWVEDFDNDLSSAMKKHKMTENTILYNGGRVQSDLKIGDKIDFKGYTSTSYDIDVATAFQNGCLYKFLAPKGTPCVNMNGLFSDTEFEVEHECLLNKNLKGTIVGFETYRVDDIQWGFRDVPLVVVQL